MTMMMLMMMMMMLMIMMLKMMMVPADHVTFALVLLLCSSWVFW